ncbi:MAG TPA: ATP-binding protein, partial [Syntrophaceae bacterium]|nr:ATP-binding protein [Syntrophaceae bacterium]
MKLEKVLVAWSGGKDSALALYTIQEEGIEISALLTTVTEQYNRISMHGVRQILLERQSHALGIPLEKVFIPPETSNEIYEARMSALLLKYANQGVTTVVFGDVFLEDIRTYRENHL